MQASYRGASREWLDAAWSSLGWKAWTGTPFTSSDVRMSLSVDVNTRDHRAIGPLIRKALRLKLIKPTGRWVGTESVVSHGRPEREWRGTSLAASTPWPERTS